ncbi:hypothetical protein JMG10_11930 [Nostoc ellipsosporum NOK]|nr:hypothetical protein [Nostoc ellipsosporum NOK]
MEMLLRNDFTTYYGLAVSTVVNISANTAAPYFELNDDNTLIYTIVGQGVAKYRNDSALNVNVINFEAFIDSLPVAFTTGKEKCDLIVHDDNRSYFLLNELTDTQPVYVAPFANSRGPQPGKRQKAISQLFSSLTLIMAVPSITAFANTHTYRHCCFFNKQAMAPATITATTAFNRLSTVATGGFRMANADIEALGFDLWEYSGNQVYTLT